MFTAAKYDKDWEQFVEGAAKAASCGLYVYYAHLHEERASGYSQVAFPSMPLTLDSLPVAIQRSASRTIFRGHSFPDLRYVTRGVIQALAGPPE
jgi:hypothetical protein